MIPLPMWIVLGFYAAIVAAAIVQKRVCMPCSQLGSIPRRHGRCVGTVAPGSRTDLPRLPCECDCRRQVDDNERPARRSEDTVRR